MKWAQECAVIVPCRNEAVTISSLVTEVRRILPEVLVVDDCCIDQTGERAAAAGARVTRTKAGGGKGAALKLGFEQARQEGFGWVLAMDGDGQHSPADIPRLLAKGENLKARMVVGNRMADTSRMPLVRRVVNRWMSAQLSRFCGMELPDSQCGFRLVDLRAWEQLSFGANYFQVESEQLVRFAMAGFVIEFVPIATRYAAERSKIHPVRDTIRWLRWWAGIRRELGGEASGWAAPSDVIADAAG